MTQTRKIKGKKQEIIMTLCCAISIPFLLFDQYNKSTYMHQPQQCPSRGFHSTATQRLNTARVYLSSFFPDYLQVFIGANREDMIQNYLSPISITLRQWRQSNVCQFCQQTLARYGRFQQFEQLLSYLDNRIMHPCELDLTLHSLNESLERFLNQVRCKTIHP